MRLSSITVLAAKTQIPSSESKINLFLCPLCDNSWLALLGSRSFLCTRGQLLNLSGIYIFIFFCILAFCMCAIPCRNCEMEEVCQSSASQRKCTTTSRSFPVLPSVKPGGSSGSCFSPSKAELAVGSRGGNCFKILSFKSKKCNYPQDWETFLGISRKEASVSAGGGWRAVETLAVAVAHFFHDHSIQHSWRLVSCLGLSVILWIVEHLMHRED